MYKVSGNPRRVVLFCRKERRLVDSCAMGSSRPMLKHVDFSIHKAKNELYLILSFNLTITNNVATTKIT
jgi:hypothetical protein